MSIRDFAHKWLFAFSLVFVTTGIEGIVLAWFWNWFVVPVVPFAPKLNGLEASGIMVVLMWIQGIGAFSIQATNEGGEPVKTSLITKAVLSSTFFRVATYACLATAFYLFLLI